MTKAQRIYEKAGCLLMAALMLLTACRHDGNETEPEEYRTMPVTLQIPADGVAKRSPGDPGEGTLLPKPTFVYLYLYTRDGSGTGTVTHVRLDNIPEDMWELTGAESSTPMYRYRGGVRIDVPVHATYGRLYGAAATTEIAPHYAGTITREDDLKNMTFTVEPKDGSYAWLRDVYSSPADLTDTKVNGTVRDIGTAVPYTTLVLYHTAAKVDFTWNVNPADAQGRTLHSIDVTARDGTVRLFRPTPGNLAGSTTYPHPVITHDAIHPGNRNYGRADTYVIQPAERTLNWTLRTTDDASHQAEHPGSGTPKDETGTIYSMWYRINARVGY